MRVFPVASACLFLALSALAAENPDKKLITPYEGSGEAYREEAREYDEVEIPLGPRAGGGFKKSQKLAGRHSIFGYPMPAGRSVLEVTRNYEAALKKAGFTILWICTPGACGGGEAPLEDFGYWPYDTGAYLAAKTSGADGETWAVLDVRPGGQEFHVIRVKAMEMDKAVVDAAALKGSLESDGHVAVYGIRFDTAKADLKPESAPAIAEIVKLLKANPDLKIHVVGHTDNVGGIDANVALSKKRAEAVMRELTGRHGIAASRLRAEGVGPFSPVATNGTDDGRAKNRRVDLVKQ